MRFLLSLAGLLLVSFVVLGCDGRRGDDFATSVVRGPLVGGVVTGEHPAVGWLAGFGSSCGATLITPRVAITAAHCVRFKVCSQPDCNLARTLTLSDGTTQLQRDVTRIHSFLWSYDALATPDWLRRDVALVELKEDVLADFATPATLAQDYPAPGEPLRLIGFGCADRCTRPTYEEGQEPDKQALDFLYGAPTTAACLGDSGGPTLTAAGAVLRVTSGSRVKEGDDLFGDVVALRDEIAAVIAAWDADPWVFVAGSPMCQMRHDCERCTSRNACGWCRNTGRCLYGNIMGPIGDTSPPPCAGADWVWGQPECPGPASQPPLVAPWEGDCAAATDCSACTRLPLCGWSNPAGRCAQGLPGGPDDADVPYEGWVFAPYCCPTESGTVCGDGECNGHETCLSCPADCGACAPRCGDLICQPEEDETSCPEDCRDAPAPDVVEGGADTALPPEDDGGAGTPDNVGGPDGAGHPDTPRDDTAFSADTWGDEPAVPLPAAAGGCSTQSAHRSTRTTAAILSLLLLGLFHRLRWGMCGGARYRLRRNTW